MKYHINPVFSSEEEITPLYVNVGSITYAPDRYYMSRWMLKFDAKEEVRRVRASNRNDRILYRIIVKPKKLPEPRWESMS